MKIAPEAPKINLGSNGHAVLKAYLSLLLVGGHVGLPLALGTMFVSHTASRRYPTLINMLVSWIVYATAVLLLYYSGEYQSREPDFGLCLAQASLVYGGTVMVGTATLCLVLQLWLEFRGRNVTFLPLRSKLLRTLAVPYSRGCPCGCIWKCQYIESVVQVAVLLYYIIKCCYQYCIRFDFVYTRDNVLFRGFNPLQSLSPDQSGRQVLIQHVTACLRIRRIHCNYFYHSGH